MPASWRSIPVFARWPGRPPHPYSALRSARPNSRRRVDGLTPASFMKAAHHDSFADGSQAGRPSPHEKRMLRDWWQGVQAKERGAPLKRARRLAWTRDQRLEDPDCRTNFPEEKLAAEASGITGFGLTLAASTSHQMHLGVRTSSRQPLYSRPYGRHFAHAQTDGSLAVRSVFGQPTTAAAPRPRRWQA